MFVRRTSLDSKVFRVCWMKNTGYVIKGDASCLRCSKVSRGNVKCVLFWQQLLHEITNSTQKGWDDVMTAELQIYSSKLQTNDKLLRKDSRWMFSQLLIIWSLIDDALSVWHQKRMFVSSWHGSTHTQSLLCQTEHCCRVLTTFLTFCGLTMFLYANFLHFIDIYINI